MYNDLFFYPWEEIPPSAKAGSVEADLVRHPETEFSELANDFKRAFQQLSSRSDNPNASLSIPRLQGLPADEDNKSNKPGKPSTRAEKLLDYDMDTRKTAKKKAERKVGRLNELLIWMKRSTAKIHIIPLNQMAEPYQVYEFLKTTFALTELDRFEDVVKKRNWLMKSDFAQQGIEHWVVPMIGGGPTPQGTE